MKFSIKDFFSKFDKIRRKKRIWSHLLKTSLMENFIFCAVNIVVRVPADLYLGPFETTTITLFFSKIVTAFCNKVLSHRFGWVLNMPKCPKLYHLP